MNPHLPSPDELLHAYLDHELEPQHEAQFFTLLSSDSEYRDRLRQLRSIRNEARRFAMAAPPPATATEALFDRLGFADAGIASAAIATRSAGSTRSRRRPMAAAWQQAWTPLAAAASAAVITAIVLLGLREGIPTADQQLLADRMGDPTNTTQVQQQDDAVTQQYAPSGGETARYSSGTRPHSTETALSQTAQTGTDRSRTTRQTSTAPTEMMQIRPVAIDAIPEADLQAVLATLNQAAAEQERLRAASHGDGTSAAVHAEPVHDMETGHTETVLAMNETAITEGSSLETSPLLAQRMTPSSDPSTSVDTRRFFPALGSSDAVQGLSMEIRGINASSFPGATISPKSDPWMQNMAIGVFYTGEHHDLGLEFGQEPFAQHYHGVENGKPVYYEQNLMTPWLHATWRYRFSSIALLGGIEPYVMVGGGTSFYFWPMAKSGFGIMYMPDRRVRFHVGLEGSVLAFPYQDNWFTTRRAGMTYGVSVLF